jgi:Fe-S-cluster containining protein
MAIDCSKCKGWCCRQIGKLQPSLDRGDLCCIHFDDETHKCKCYDTRPLICNTDLLYDKCFAGVMPREVYDRKNKESCDYLANYYMNSIKDIQ